jgi:fucose 4-O-acetylase-like acetyltransferase
MPLKAESDNNTFQWVYIAKGIGIILVVVGHFHPACSPAYWSEIRKIIYAFHMPLFFILSGYLYSHDKYSYRDLIRNKIKRLLYPFATIAVGFFPIKYIAGKIAHLEHPVDMSSVCSLFIDPVHSYMPLLWFVHALLLIFVVYPLARLILNNFLILLLLIGIVSFIGSDDIIFGKSLANMPFFVVGVILRENVRLSKMTTSADWPHIVAPILMFVSIYAVRLLCNFEQTYGYLFKFILGATGALFVINLSQVISTAQSEKSMGVLLQIGYHSITIYLFHTLFESTVRIGFLQGIRFIQTPFEVIALTAVICGVFFPLELEKRVLRKYSITRRFVLGIT